MPVEYSSCEISPADNKSSNARLRKELSCAKYSISILDNILTSSSCEKAFLL
jgi:hypothetical protein